MTQPQKQITVNWILVFTVVTFLLALTLRAGTLEEKVAENERISRETTTELKIVREILSEIRADVKSIIRDREKNP